MHEDSFDKMADNAQEDQFFQQLKAMCDSTKNKVLMSKEEYFSTIDEVKLANEVSTKTPRQYYLLKRYVKPFK